MSEARVKARPLPGRPRLYYVTGRIDGEYVAGFEIGRDREQARRRVRKRLGATARPGRPRRGTPRLKIESIDLAAEPVQQ